MQGDSCCREDKKKPELQDAFGTKKHKLFKVERTTWRGNVSSVLLPNPTAAAYPANPSPPNSEISRCLMKLFIPSEIK